VTRTALLALVSGVGLFGIGCYWLIGSIKVRVRRWNVREEQKRCDLETAPIYCGRNRK
jgi:hypothetical protein